MLQFIPIKVPSNRRSATTEYRPFPNVNRRNMMQEFLEVPMLIRSLRLPKNQRMLEAGCGRGIALPVFARQCQPSRLVGLDLEASFLREAEARIQAQGLVAELRQGDLREMPFADGDFDIVVDFGTCYHITQPEAALQEISRVLRPGGWFIYETPMSQLLAHPVRSFGRTLPWQAVPQLVRRHHALLWACRAKR